MSKVKPIVLVNNFGDFDKTCSYFELTGGISFQSVFQAAKERLGSKKEEALAKHKEQSNVRTLIRSLKQVFKESKQYHKFPQTSGGIKTEGIFQAQLSDEKLLKIAKLKNAFFLSSRADDFPLNKELECEINFPENLYLYTSKVEHFKLPEKSSTGALSHCLLNSTSVLPALCLDVRHGELVLDAFSGSGDKALLILQTLYPEQLICTETNDECINSIRTLMQEYIFDFSLSWENKRVILHSCDVCEMDTFHSFDKILVDVPSSFGHPALLYSLNDMIEMRDPVYLPELQINILENCIRLLRPGGTLIYATHSVMREQNDAVVHIALRNVFYKFKITVTIKDLSHVVQHFTDTQIFKEVLSQQYGLLILPHELALESPLYICKITREKA